jgi:hypothetical protein
MRKKIKMQKLKTIAFILLIIGSSILLLFCLALLIFSGSGMGGIVGLMLVGALGIVFFIILFWLHSLKVFPAENESKYSKFQLFGIYLFVLPLFFFALVISPRTIQLLQESINNSKLNLLSKRKAPIKNGIAQFEYLDIQYTVPCKDNEIHGKVIIAHNDYTFKQEIYFNQGQIDSTLYYYEKDETLHIYPLNDSSALAVRHYLDYGLMKKDTTIEFADLLWSEYWFYED